LHEYAAALLRKADWAAFVRQLTRDPAVRRTAPTWAAGFPVGYVAYSDDSGGAVVDAEANPS
jgi:hypothetical protein